MKAQSYRSQRSTHLRSLWQEYRKPNALIVAVQEGLLNERWVVDAISGLQQDQNNSQQRELVDAVLQKTHLPPAEPEVWL